MNSKHLFQSERGSVSIFLIMVVTVIFIFNAVLIDYARILAAKNQSERTVQAAVRSVLSSYDSDLYNTYGLFGFSGDEKDIFTYVVEKNLQTSPGYFNLIETKIVKDSISVELDHQLGYHEVFEQQIMEEMKYKAPVDFTLELLSYFKGLSLVMKEASKTTVVLKNIKDQYELRQVLLEETIQYQMKSADLVKSQSISSLEDLDYIVDNYKEYVKDYIEYMNLSVEKEENLEQLKKKIKLYQNKATETIQNIYDDYHSILEKHNEYLFDAVERLDNASKANKQIKSVISDNNLNQDKNQYDKVNDEKNNLTEINKTINELKKVTDDLERTTDLVITDEFFENLKGDITEQKRKYAKMVENIENLQMMVSQAIYLENNNQLSEAIINQTIKQMKGIIGQISSLNREYRKEFVKYSQSGNKIFETKQEIADMLQLDKNQIEQQEKTATKKLQTINDLFKAMETIKSIDDDFNRVEEFYSQYLDFNSTKDYSIDNNLDLDPVEVSKDAMEEMDQLFLNLADFIDKITNELYINEFAYSKFNHFNPSNIKDLLTIPNKKDINLQYDQLKIDELSDLLGFNQQELEYIVYGSHTVGGNISKAFRDIFLIRLAINTMEGFTDSKVRSLSHPLAILMGAISYGISRSISDIVNMINGEEVFLANKLLKVQFGYDDYLRLLLLIHSNKMNKLSRIQAVIQYKTNKDLRYIATYVRGTTTTSIELWFLTGVMSALNYIGVIDGRIRGKDYIITKTAAMSY
ncbi:hypothetical protein BHF71_02500 [Vulcanibacillus modesticaldus]|uniref:Uncharacterized protein n=1 Tax=Vulcanibacillus modesticaldus TaxID=337097 RepID=A0A1D2YTP2_9BACI|nr:DUF5702 domain-containing protein [Vulcanibacillus modesticaldus]OEF99072.1 hypothetical protein BHF71_02500 [Vulcanibacillus modesticaldus]